MSGGRKAVFLDRDGTINEDLNYVYKVEDFHLLSGAAKAIKLLNDSGWLVIVVSNQSSVARNYCAVQDIDKVNSFMVELLSRQGARLDGIYFCPHLNQPELAGGNPEYLIDCACRKPKTGMILQACSDFEIDLADSWVIGDSDKDVLLGKKAGIKTIGVLTGNPPMLFPSMPDLICKDLLTAVKYIVESDNSKNESY